MGKNRLSPEALFAGLLAAVVIWSADPPDASDKPVITSVRKEYIDRVFNSPFTFHGTVMNEEGRSVKGARVHMIFERVKGMDEGLKLSRSTLTVVTDCSGRFSIGPVEGWRITLKKIECDGYLFDPGLRSPLTFFPVTHPSMLKSPIYFRQDRRFPVVFILERLQ